MTQKNHRRRLFVIAGSLVVLVAGIWAYHVVPLYLVSIHQNNATQELAAWESEYSTITSDEDAIRTAEMLGYVQSYNLVGDGYRSDSESDVVLENQRQKTIDSFVIALKRYTDMDFGADSQKWIAALSGSSTNPPDQ